MGDRSLYDDPKFLRKLHGWLTVFWVANFPPVIVLYILVDNDTFQTIILLYITLVSIWANAASHWAAHGAERVEVKQDMEE